jgi:hypothetical protein
LLVKFPQPVIIGDAAALFAAFAPTTTNPHRSRQPFTCAQMPAIALAISKVENDYQQQTKLHSRP